MFFVSVDHPDILGLHFDPMNLFQLSIILLWYILLRGEVVRIHMVRWRLCNCILCWLNTQAGGLFLLAPHGRRQGVSLLYCYSIDLSHTLRYLLIPSRLTVSQFSVSLTAIFYDSTLRLIIHAVWRKPIPQQFDSPFHSNVTASLIFI